MARKALSTLSHVISVKDTKKYQWLYWLKKAYELADSQTAKTIKLRNKNARPKIVCTKGCAACCYNPAVPIVPVELQGISWFSCEIMDKDNQNKLIQNLLGRQNTTKCPFLINEHCSIYPLRPLACRHFLMTNQKCQPYEDITVSRPQDMVVLNPKECSKVATLMFRAEGKPALESRRLAQQKMLFEKTVQMHDIDLNDLIRLILATRKKRSL